MTVSHLQTAANAEPDAARTRPASSTSGPLTTTPDGLATGRENGLPNRGESRRYRFGFVLTTASGNMTRYLNLRKYADKDEETECVWAPISHYLEPDPYLKLPMPVRARLIVRDQARPVMSELARLDMVMYHAFEPFLYAVTRSYLRKRPLIAWSADNPPVTDPATYPFYGGIHNRSPRRQKMRLALDLWSLRRVARFFPWSKWSGRILTDGCGMPADRVHPINVGLDLELWPYVPKSEVTPNTRPQILFVGGNFVRKGGDLLLDVYRQKFAGRADLHLVTTEPPAELPIGVSIYTDMRPNDPRLRELYAKSDLFVMPTRADMSPLVMLEAMATGLPVISSRVGGIPDMVQNGESGFLIEPGDGDALASSLESLLTDPARRRAMGATGRGIIERDFNAEVCVPRILGEMKRAVDESRTQTLPR